MKCKNHSSKDAEGTCVECGKFFCDNCMIGAGRKNLCKECASEQLKDHHANKAGTNVVVTQNVNTNTSTSDKLRGSLFWLIFWILVCWPVAIIYYFIRRWK